MAVSSDGGRSWLAGFKTDYESIFVEDWSPYFGAVLLVLVIIGLMISGLFWGVFGGLKLWGDWFNTALGLGPVVGVPEHLETPLIHRLSLMNITLVIGAFCAALLSRKFKDMKGLSAEDLAATVFVRVQPKVISLLDYRRGFGWTKLVRA